MRNSGACLRDRPPQSTAGSTSFARGSRQRSGGTRRWPCVWRPYPSQGIRHCLAQAPLGVDDHVAAGKSELAHIHHAHLLLPRSDGARRFGADSGYPTATHRRRSHTPYCPERCCTCLGTGGCVVVEPRALSVFSILVVQPCAGARGDGRRATTWLRRAVGPDPLLASAQRREHADIEHQLPEHIQRRDRESQVQAA
jgi:hypothetical protein